MSRRAILVLLLVSMGCDGDAIPQDGGADAGAPEGAVVRFEPTADGPMGWDALPFPSDLHLAADGRVDLGSMPYETPAWASARQTLNLRRGFCVACGAWFAIDGEIDLASLPAEVTFADTPSIDDLAVLMEIDPDTPESPLLPVDVGYVARYGVVSVQYVGALEPDRTYALALTSALRGADGTPVAPSPIFEQVRDADTGGGPEAERARPLYRAALEDLEAAGLARERVVGLAVFTTDDLSTHLLALGSVVEAPSPPSVTVDRVFMRDDGGVDMLMGTPDLNRPGREVRPATGTEGTRALRHETTLAVVLGRFGSPRVVEGSGTDIGRLLRDDDGNPTAGLETEAVPFMLIIPDVPLDSLRVMVFHNAFAAWLQTTAVMADTAGRHGVAVLGVEGFNHGSRSAAGHDRGYDLRGDDLLPAGETEADGLFGHGPEMVLRHFGFTGVPEDQQASPEYFLAASSQLVVDVLSALRLVTEGDVSAIASSDPSLAALSFDPAGVFFSGWSLGGSVGAVAITVDDSVAGAVLNVAPAGVGRSICAENEVLTQIDLLGLRDLGFRGEPGRQRCFDPLASLYAWYIEPVDPLALATYLYRAPITSGPRPDILIQYAGDDTAVTVRAQTRYLHVLGVPAVGEFGPGVSTPMSTPFSANLTTPSGPVTAGAYQHPGADHGMMIVRDVDPDDPAINPIEDVHAQIEHFLATRIAEGRAEIAPPP